MRRLPKPSQFVSSLPTLEALPAPKDRPLKPLPKSNAKPERDFLSKIQLGNFTMDKRIFDVCVNYITIILVIMLLLIPGGDGLGEDVDALEEDGNGPEEDDGEVGPEEDGVEVAHVVHGGEVAHVVHAVVPGGHGGCHGHFANVQGLALVTCPPDPNLRIVHKGKPRPASNG